MVATKVYGAKEVRIGTVVRMRIEVFEKSGSGNLPVCMARTQMSISHDPMMKKALTNYTFTIVGVEMSADAGFTCMYALAGEKSTVLKTKNKHSVYRLNRHSSKLTSTMSMANTSLNLSLRDVLLSLTDPWESFRSFSLDSLGNL